MYSATNGRRSKTADSRFLRYFFPLEADWRKHFEQQLSQPSSQASLGSKSNGPLDAPANANLRLPMYGHYDVVCPWNPEDPALDTNAFSPQLGYVRLQTAKICMPSESSARAQLHRAKDAPSSTIRNDPTFLTNNEGPRTRPQSAMVGRRALGNYDSLKVRPMSAAVGREKEGARRSVGETICSNMAPPLEADEDLVDSPAWVKFTSPEFNQMVDIQELAAWVLKLRPRSVHDLKPVLVLVQGLLSDIIMGKMKFFSAEMLELKTTIRKMQEEYESALAELQKCLEERQLAETEPSPAATANHVQVRTILEKSVMKFQSLKDAHNLDQARAKLQESLAERAKLDMHHAQTMSQLKADNRRMVENMRTKEQRLARMQKRMDELELTFDTMKSDTSSATRRVAELERLLEEANQRARVLMAPKYSMSAERHRTASRYAELMSMFNAVETRTWMSQNGHVCVAMALDCLEPRTGLEVVGALDATNAAYVLEIAHPATASRVVAEMLQSPKVRDVLPHLDQEHLGAVAAEMSHQEFGRLSQIHAPSATVGRAKKTWTRARDLLAKDFPVQEEVDAIVRGLSDLQPRVGAFLLAEARASTAATVLRSMSLGLKCELLRQLSDMDNSFALASGVVGKEDDALLKKGALLGRVSTMDDLQEKATSLAQKLTVHYGVTVTLAVIGPEADEVADDFQPEDAAAGGVDVAPPLIDEVEPEPKPEGFVSELVARQALLGKQSLEMMKGLLVLVSSEGSAASCSHLSHEPVPLSALQERAIERGEVVRTRHSMVLPVMYSGKCFGVISARAAVCESCGRQAGRAPGLVLEHPNMGKALESMADGIKDAAHVLKTAEEESLRNLDKLIERGDSVPPSASNEESLKSMRLLLVLATKQATTLAQDALVRQLQALKSHDSPPPQVVKIMMGLFQMLKQPGLSKVVDLPVRSLDIETGLIAWKFLRACVELNYAYPNFLINLMQEAVHSRLGSDLSKINKDRLSATVELLGNITHSEANKVPEAIARIRKYMLCLLAYHRLALLVSL